jgi:RND family efflux transporter MFP subunit
VEKTAEEMAPRLGEGAGFDTDRLFWRHFVEATTPRAFCQSWLPLQCRMLDGVRCGMVLLGDPDTGPFSPVAVWPDAKLDMNHLTSSAEQSLRERRGLVIPTENGDTVHLSYPIIVADQLHGVVVLEVNGHQGPGFQSTLRMLHWGTAWLEVLIRRGEAQKASTLNQSLENVLELVASAVEHDGFHTGAMSIATRMATIFECDRVSVGFVLRNTVKVEVISHTADFGKETNLVRAIGAAMDEALDQRSSIAFPLASEESPLVTRAHAELSKHHGSGAILTVPLENNGKYVGGLTLERPADRPFGPDVVEVCEAVGSLVGPILETKRQEDRWLIRKIADEGADQLKKVIGAGYLVRKIVLISLAFLIAFFSIYKVDHKVSAPTSIEGKIQRSVAAPFNGFIKESPVRPGDVVNEGDLLCLLDDRDLLLERLKWTSEKDQLANQYHEAMAKRERSQIRITRAKIEQAEAQLGLIEEHLGRTRVTAPFDGVIMSGDLSQSLGSPVERGQELFKVAPLDAYRVIVEVEERDITHVQVGQKSELVLPSMPSERFPFVVEQITPVSLSKDGRNYFRVEARMETVSDHLRPGMEGIGKITVNQRKLIWVWTHKATDWLRLQLWRYKP